MKTSITSFHEAPYFDDFNLDDEIHDNKNVFEKNYHRLLFQPAYAIQTRELNQLQSILQNQVGELGSGLINAYHGGVVKEGETEFVDGVRFVDAEFDNPFTQDIKTQIDKITKLQTRNEHGEADLELDVLGIRYVDGETYRIWFKYRNVGDNDKSELAEDDLLYPFENDQEIAFGPTVEGLGTAEEIINASPFDDEEIEDVYKEEINTLFAFSRVLPREDEISEHPAGWGFSISVNEGIFLVKGTLVRTFPQRDFFIKEKRHDRVNGHIAFLIRESIVTPEEDITLRDNAAGSYNYAAPGADRYRIQLELAFNTSSTFLLNANSKTSTIFNGEDEDFTAPFLNIRSVYQNEVMNVSAPLSLSESIEAGTARRTHDESGNYTVRPFTISIKETLLENHNNGKHKLEDAIRNETLTEMFQTVDGFSISEDDYTDPAQLEDQNTTIHKFRNFLRNYLAVDIDPSIAYVKGHRIESAGVRTVYLRKARDISEDRTTGINFLRGNYIDVVYNPANGTAVNFDQILGDKIRGIKFIGIVGPRDIEFNAPATTADAETTRAGWLIYRLYVYNNFTTDDIPNFFHLRYVPSSIDDADNIPLYDRSIKNPRTSTSLFPIGYKGVRQVKNVEFAFLHEFSSVSIIEGTYKLTGIPNAFFSVNNFNDIIVKNHENEFENAAEIFQSFDINNGDLVLTPKPGINGAKSFIVPLRVNDVSNYRKTKTAVHATEQEIEVDCATGYAVLPHQDVIISSIKCSENGCDLSFRVVDDGLGDNFYENPILKFDTNGSYTTKIDVDYWYYEHSGGSGSGAGYFSVESYMGGEFDTAVFEQIPKQGDSRLSDFIDFRVKRERKFEDGHFISEDATENIMFLQANVIGQIVFNQFLPRTDILHLNSENDFGERGMFEILEGDPSLEPVPKRVSSSSMPLYELNVPPYTYFAHNVDKGYIDNNRYTMGDIGRLEKRIENLEYYSSLSLLEKEAEGKKILDLTEEGAGFERFKNGILVDSFMNQNVGDIANPDYSAAVNTALRTMGPSFSTYSLRAKYAKRWRDTGEENFNDITGEITNVSGSVVDNRQSEITVGNNPGYVGAEQLSLDHGEREILFESLYASQTVSVQPYEVTVWNGQIKLSPSSDEWIDTDRLPDFAVDFSQISDFMETAADLLVDLWGTDETLIRRRLIGTHSGTSTSVANVPGRHGQNHTTTTTTTRTFQDEIEQSWLETETNTIDIDFGDRVVDVSVIPWIRSRDIYFRGSGFKPNTAVYLYFDEVNVTDYALQTEFKLFSTTDNVEVYNNEFPSDWSGEGTFGALKTESDGTIEGVLRIPNNDDLRFRTGIREFKLTSNQFNNDLEADTLAATTYNAMGLVQQKEFVGAAVRVPQIDLHTRTIFRTFNRSSSSSTTVYRDPIAQTFYIDEAEYGSGIFLTDVDLYFATKPDNDNSIITVYLVKCENGIPTKFIVPGSEKTLMAKDIIVSGRDIVESNTLLQDRTRFTFDYPIYLEGGEEYALIVFGDTPEYRIWTGVLGQEDLITNYPITKNPSFGVFLQSQNQRTWTPYQYRNMMIRLHKAVFETNKTVSFEFKTNFGGQNLSDVALTYLQPFFKTLELPQTRLDFNVLLQQSNNVVGTGAKYVKSKLLSAGEELPFSHEVTGADNIVVRARLTSFNRNVSPAIDCETGSLYFRSNNINNDFSGEGAIYDFVNNEWSHEPEDVPSSGGNALARYITKRVVLNNPSEDLRTIMAVHKPIPGANIKLFAKRKITSKFDTSIQNETGWYEMQLYSVNGDTGINTIPVNRIGASDFTDVEFVLPLPDPNFEDAPEMQTTRDAYGKLTEPSEGFVEFMIKVVFLSTDKAQVCKIKNFMTIASL